MAARAVIALGCGGGGGNVLGDMEDSAVYEVAGSGGGFPCAMGTVKIGFFLLVVQKEIDLRGG